MTTDAKFNGDWKTESLELRDALAAYKNAPVVAYATTNEDGDLSMLWFPRTRGDRPGCDPSSDQGAAVPPHSRG